MRKEDLHDVVERLEALDSLSQLFKNLWFGKIKDEIKDEKVKAYLMVFEDAFPGLDHVVSFVSKNAQHLSESPVYQVKEEFEVLSQSLLNREIEMDLDLDDEIDPGIFEEESLDGDDFSIDDLDGEELVVVDEGAIDDLFTDPSESARDEESGEDDLADLLSDDEESGEDDLADLLSDDEESGEDDLADLLSDDEESGEDDLADLLSDDEESGEDDLDIEGLLDKDDTGGGEGEAADLSEDELSALLGDEDPPAKKKAAPKVKKK